MLQSVDTKEVRERLLHEGVAVLDGVLGDACCAKLRDVLRQLDQSGQLQPGRVTHGANSMVDATARGDRMCFIKPDDLEPDGLGGHVSAYVEQAERLMELLSAIDRAEGGELFDALGSAPDGVSVMCAIYPGGGARYVKHRDALPYKTGRKITMIYYCNEPGWAPECGGELQLWPREGEPPVRVAPVADRLVVFVASLEHEVLPSWRERYAVTTWMYNRRDQKLEALVEGMREEKRCGRFDAGALLRELDDDSSDDEGDEGERSARTGVGRLDSATDGLAEARTFFARLRRRGSPRVRARVLFSNNRAP